MRFFTLPRSCTPFPARRLVSCAGLLVLGACAGSAAAVIGTALQVGANLVSTTSQNYGGAYAEQMEELLTILREDVEERTGLEAYRSASATRGISSDSRRGGDSGPLTLDVAVLKEGRVNGRFVPVPVKDGAVLRDGHGDPQGGDNLKISFRSNRKAWVYVVGVDATGWVSPIFPQEGLGNPVGPGSEVVIPEGDRWFPLDEYRGIETLYFLASYQPRPDLENLLADLAAQERPAVTTASAARVTEEAVITRGVGRRRAGRATAVLSSTGETHSVRPTAFEAAMRASDFVVTRWFRHE